MNRTTAHSSTANSTPTPASLHTPLAFTPPHPYAPPSQTPMSLAAVTPKPLPPASPSHSLHEGPSEARFPCTPPAARTPTTARYQKPRTLSYFLFPCSYLPFAPDIPSRAALRTNHSTIAWQHSLARGRRLTICPAFHFPIFLLISTNHRPLHLCRSPSPAPAGLSQRCQQLNRPESNDYRPTHHVCRSPPPAQRYQQLNTLESNTRTTSNTSCNIAARNARPSLGRQLETPARPASHHLNSGNWASASG
jgi:hypothetical protein